MTAFARQHVLVIGPFDSVSGYGNDLLGLTGALQEMGADVHLSPVSVIPPIPPNVAQLLCKPIDPPYDLCIIHRDPLLIECPKGARETARKVIGWTMWEYEEYREQPGYDPKWKPLRERLADFDGLFSYDPVSHKALDPYAEGVVKHQIVQGGYDADLWEPLERDWDGTFRFAMLGRITGRKNPWAALKAWRIFKTRNPDADAEFHIKTNYRYLHPGVADSYGVRIHYAYWSQLQVKAFYSKMHCLLAPSRGEGKNIPALEALTTGIPVIATNYGGHTMWLSNNIGYPLSYTVADSEYGPCAEVDPEELAEAMHHVYHNRDEARQKGEMGSQVIPASCDWEKALQRLGDCLKDIPAREVKDTA